MSCAKVCLQNKTEIMLHYPISDDPFRSLFNIYKPRKKKTRLLFCFNLFCIVRSFEELKFFRIYIHVPYFGVFILFYDI